jgi:hypothetical protein
MPFKLTKGRFVPSAGIPDGDSVRFRADNTLWNKLEGRPSNLGPARRPWGRSSYGSKVSIPSRGVRLGKWEVE